MLVTGVQAVGAKGVTAVQGAVVEPKAANPVGSAGDRDQGGNAGPTKPGEPQRVLFARSGLETDHRPASLREHHAAKRYLQDGGQPRPKPAA